ncbi:acyltransferase [Nocardia asteroides NBRC 15531]|uniref:Acyltransferase n=1 Tax=Nocardia asteroides NBRC 15531 TaxID=1110697 RepID=U5E320_NOCAS|nr:acyltransferase family protein [Nocardia asteroides]TLF70511.1 acyltransferase [Nocardia asteroides NBRC 15531]UGT50063.1 acyltransferase [Nocardia asteroides]SFN21823.1 Peptidoglycan/LPS O-acetylase OafA/YrhL, contains acyltransferase and SGNH-hydrolase domains [Nocardia asteroides]VEG37172.1 O-acetyltransferase OatA [Nocardia asteroides]GAD81767.1 putative acyltransferase [Nocardia asteroides NBRC 15531]
MTGVKVGAVRTSAESRSTASVYRDDLDGLRGLAIALVVVFHVWFGRVSGGVDVFLVLSGFFFTGLVLRRAERVDSPWAWAVVRRTARRLVPAMAVVLAAVVAATIAWQPYTQWSATTAQVLASTLYFQNWQLAWTWSDYLAADPSVSPLQHLWSMSVQGQFYVAALLAVAVIARWCVKPDRIRLVLGAVVVAAGLASFGYATSGTATHQGWNYYDTFARGWELLAGAGLAVVAPYVVPARRIRGVLAGAGLAGVVLCGWLIVDGANRFPGPAALLPVAAAAAVILSAAHLPPGDRPWPNRILAHPVMRWLGDHAYPLYLWHWPILIFFLAESGSPHADLAEGSAVIGISLLLAWLTRRWVELPLRRGADADRKDRGDKGTRTVWAVVGLLLAATMVIAVGWQSAMRMSSASVAGVLDSEKYPGAEALASGAPTPPEPLRPSVFDASADAPPPTGDGCIADWDTREVITCAYGDLEAERTLALVGSSHAEHWLPALQVLAEEHAFRVQVYLKMGCPLTMDADALYRGEPNPDCRDWSAEVIDRLGVDRPDWVFTTGTRPRDEGGDETPDDYLAVWSALSDRGLNVVAVRDTPWLRRGAVRYKATDCLAAGGDRVTCGMRREEALAPVNPALAPSSAFPSVFPIDLSDAVCEPTLCSVAEGNILIYHDEHHLTASYSRSLSGALGRELQPILGWW